MSLQCALCDNGVSNLPLHDGDNVFCCNGCHVVFNILASKNQLSNFHDNPIFQQAVRSGLISNPALLDQIRKNRVTVSEQELVKLPLEISDMWCPSCAEIIRLILLQEKGINNCVVDYTTDLASIEYSPRHISKEKIFKLIQSLGYSASALHTNRHSVNRSLYLRFGIAAFCSLNVMMFSYPLYASYFYLDLEGYGNLFAWLSLISILPVVTYCSWPIYKRFFSALKAGLYGMETLVVIAVFSTLILSIFELYQGGVRVYFDSLSVIITFVLLGKIIEAKAKFSAKDSILRLVKERPRRGRKRFPDGSQAFVPIKEVVPGDILVAFSGEKIVLDGIVVDGEGNCDESLMTGESVPLLKKIDSKLVGGSILQNGWIAYRVTNSVEESTMQKIFDMIQQELGNKVPYFRAADNVVQWFVPFVLFLAATTAAFLAATVTYEEALIRAVTVLLISCPCAIGIAVPLAEAHLMYRLASLGVIVRNRGCLSLLGRETVFVFDKTGTITEGVFTVISGLNKLTSKQKSILKGLASHSTHPISCAIVRAIDAPALMPESIEEFAGKGLRAVFEGTVWRLGSAAFLHQEQINNVESSNLEECLVSTVYVSEGEKCVATLQLGDQLRQDVLEIIQHLKSRRTVLLSGDANATVGYIAKVAGFHEWKGEQNPLQKRLYVESLRNEGHIVCMVGDGINDAPALAAAHIGISIVSATDISIQVSDLLLTTERLQCLPQIQQLAKKGQKIIKQNLFWAFFYNVVGMGLAIFGLLTPLFAAFAMLTSSFIVLLNARRVNSTQ